MKVKVIMTAEEITTVKSLIEYYNSVRPRCLHISESSIFCNDEKETIRNVFEFVRNDYSYLNGEWRNKLLMKLSTEMFELGMITSDENIMYHWMFRVYSPWGYMC